MNDKITSDFNKLLQKFIDRTIAKEEHLRLEAILLEHEPARIEYLIATNFDASMQAYADFDWDREEHEVTPPGLLPTSASQTSVGLVGTLVFSVVAVPVVIALITFMYTDAPSEFTASARQLTLTVLSTKEAVSDENQPFENRQLLLGRVAMASGLLTVGTSGGSLVSLEGPCEFEMVGDQIAKLHSGKMVAFCGADSEKLTVSTPTGDYIDVGTEFGVVVSKYTTRLHVFDGEVGATNSRFPKKQMMMVKAASSLRSKSDGSQHHVGMVDFAGFGELRKALSESVLHERFSSPLFENSDRYLGQHWKVGSSLSDQPRVRVETENPLLKGMGGYLKLDAQAIDVEDAAHFPLLSAYWDYGRHKTVDLSLPHSIECLIRLDSDPIELVNLEMFGGNAPTWKNRLWEVKVIQKDGKTMWSVYSSNIGTKKKRQFLEIKRGVAYFLQVEIDPRVGRYRITVSDGKDRIRTQLYDGTPLELKKDAGPLGLVYWQLRSKPGKQMSFSIDEVQIRNRPVFDDKPKSNGARGNSTSTQTIPSVDSGERVVGEETAIGKLYSDNEDKQKWTSHPAPVPPAAIPDSVSLPALPQDQQWEISFVDNFDGEAIDETKWNILGDGPRKYGNWRKSNAMLDGKGNLVLRVNKGKTPDYGSAKTQVAKEAFFGGGLDSNDKFEQAYGYYECRCKMLKDDGSGYHCSFWLQADTMGDVTEEGKNGTEIDIIEKFHNNETIQHCLHWDGYREHHKRSKFEVNWPGVQSGFHIYALKWTPLKYTFYVDGVKTWTTDAGGVSQVPSFLRLTTEFSQGWNGDIHKADLPDDFVVDYVKVYRARSQSEIRD